MLEKITILKWKCDRCGKEAKLEIENSIGSLPGNWERCAGTGENTYSLCPACATKVREAIDSMMIYHSKAQTCTNFYPNEEYDTSTYEKFEI